MSRKKKIRICEVCGIDNSDNKNVYNTNKFGHKMTLCSKHYRQMNLYGRTKRNRFDKNEIIEHGSYIEIITYDRDGIKTGSTLVSSQHKNIVDKYKWSLSKEHSQTYAVTHTHSPEKKNKITLFNCRRNIRKMS